MDDQHPADGLLETIRDTFNGTGFKQTLRDAWDRLHGAVSPSPQSDHDAAVQQMNNQAQADRVASANKSHLDATQAAAIRARASKAMGK